jgi:DDE superfamily endonuclease/Helix-turn-helix of DDE superfamily endonuclease
MFFCVFVCAQLEMDVVTEEEVLLTSPSAVVVDVEHITTTATQTDLVTASTSVQTDMTSTKAALSFEQLSGNSKLLHYYTGLEVADKLLAVFATLGPVVNNLSYYRTGSVVNISPINQFILMLAKLRQDLDYLPLSHLCGVSEFTAQNIFTTWVNLCARQWSEINLWPNGDLIKYFCPEDFKLKFPSTRVIIDGTEIPIKKPANPVSQRATFSSYKNRNTVKVVVGSTPGGMISFLSPAYGGAVSDRQIIERSGLPSMCDAGDSVMADKGFNVQDLFARNDVTVNIPTFFKKKNRLSGRQVLLDRKISSKRVHIERIIGMLKTFKILTSPLTSSEVRLSTHIISVCIMLCNFRKNIVSGTA